MSVWYWIIKVEPYDLCHKFDIVISKCSISSSFYIKIFDQEVGGYSWQIISNGFCLSDIVLGFDNYRLSIKWLKANPFKHLLLSNPTTPRPQLGRVTYQKKTDRKKSWLVKVGLDSIKSKTCGWNLKEASHSLSSPLLKSAWTLFWWKIPFWTQHSSSYCLILSLHVNNCCNV